MTKSLRENIILNKILVYPEFKEFYQREWIFRGCNTTTDWEVDPLCPQYAIQGFNDKTNNPYIRLRQIPTTLNDAFLAAHEMGHIIRHFDGEYVHFPKAKTLIAQTYKDDEIIEMGGKLGSMLDDPLIDLFLRKNYGFDPDAFYTDVIIPDVNKSLDSYGDSPYEWHIFKQALFYSQFSLQFDAVKSDNALHEYNKLISKYKIIRPKTAKIGNELYFMSKEKGYDESHKQRELFSRIFDKYRINSIKLGDILSIK